MNHERIDHVQFAMPAGEEERARFFTETPLVSPNYRNHRTWQFEEARGLSLTK
jgi:hypothetical protein